MYDLQTTIFSPEGRIFQVEYANKAVENGETIVGVKCKDGVLVGAEKQLVSKLQLPHSNKRLFALENSVGCAINGRIPDGRHVVTRAKSDAATYLEQFGIEVPVKVLSDRVGQYVHAYTLYGAYRPFGMSMVMAGWDDHQGFQLFMLDPNGNAYGYHSVATGKGKQTAKTEMEKTDFSQLTCQEALQPMCRLLHLCHDENKEKIYEVELSWVTENNGHRFQQVPLRLKEQAENQALQQIQQEQDE